MFRSKTSRFFEAIREGDEEQVTRLLGRGVNPNARKRGVPALVEAVTNGNIHAVLALLAAGADADPAGVDPSALGIACQNGELEMVSLLLDAGASSEVVSADGRTPLMRLLSSLPFAVRRVDPAAPFPEDATPSDGVVAAVSTINSILDSMQKRSGPRAVDVPDNALYLVKRLILSEPTIDTPCRQGRTALHYALETYLPAPVIRLLLEAGASKGVPDVDGRTPETMAQHHPSEAVRELF